MENRPWGIAWWVCGLRRDRQVHGHTGVDIEPVVGLGLVYIVSDTAAGRAPAGFLFAERPEVVATVSGKVASLHIKPNQYWWPAILPCGNSAYFVFTRDFIARLMIMH